MSIMTPTEHIAMSRVMASFVSSRWIMIALRALACSLGAVALSVLTVGAVFAIFGLGGHSAVSHTSITKCAVTDAGCALFLSWTMPLTGEGWRNDLWLSEPGSSAAPTAIDWPSGEP